MRFETGFLLIDSPENKRKINTLIKSDIILKYIMYWRICRSFSEVGQFWLMYEIREILTWAKVYHLYDVVHALLFVPQTIKYATNRQNNKYIKFEKPKFKREKLIQMKYSSLT